MAILTFPTMRTAGWPITKTIMTQSLINSSVSGKRTVLAEWTYPIYRIEFPVNGMRSDPVNSGNANQDWQALTGFYKLLGGPATPFHWTDLDDNSATAQNIGTGDGATRQFFFQRTLGGYTEPVQDVTNVTNVKVNGTTTGAYSLVLDPNWGFVIGILFSAAPGAGQAVTATFTYQWPCEFENDGLDLSNFARFFWEAKKISFVTKKVF